MAPIPPGEMPAMNAVATAVEDQKAVFRLDVEYQHAIKVHDVATIKRIHADDMILVLGNGTVRTGAELEENARKRTRTYEKQDVIEGTRKVRVWGDTAMVTALLWLKGTVPDGAPFDYKLWFSDTYVRIGGRWRYAFGQASLPLS
jgi:ketosteroid isomerase-like protein